MGARPLPRRGSRQGDGEPLRYNSSQRRPPDSGPPGTETGLSRARLRAPFFSGGRRRPNPILIIALLVALAWVIQRSLAVCALVVAGVPLHPRSGLLEGDRREPDPRAHRLPCLHGPNGRAHRHRRRPRETPPLRMDAHQFSTLMQTLPHLRLPHSGNRLFRHWHGAGPHRHCHLRAARPHLRLTQLGIASTPQSLLESRPTLRRRPPVRSSGRSNCPLPFRRSMAGLNQTINALAVDGRDRRPRLWGRWAGGAGAAAPFETTRRHSRLGFE